MKRGLRAARNRGTRAIVRLLTAMAVILILVVFVDMRIRPAVEDMIAYQARARAFQTINTAVLQALEGEAVTGGDIVRVTRAGDGSIASIETDIVAVNRLKAQVAGAVADELEKADSRIVRVPLGTLLGSQIVAGRGPEVEMRVIPVGYVQSELYNEFVSAGINQTLHRILLKVSVQMAGVMPGYSVRTETSTNFCVAETVIVGAIPDGYTIVDGDGRSALDKINDYNASK